ncbi:MAG: hypothetical protein M3Q31_12730 [Actinomycetota bacterium]|nr:hypothetical protein [Actinomycetota bacterium]
MDLFGVTLDRGGVSEYLRESFAGDDADLQTAFEVGAEHACYALAVALDRVHGLPVRLARPLARRLVAFAHRQRAEAAVSLFGSRELRLAVFLGHLAARLEALDPLGDVVVSA